MDKTDGELSKTKEVVENGAQQPKDPLNHKSPENTPPTTATKADSDSKPNNNAAKVDIPKWPNHFWDVKPEIRRLTYHHFKNFRDNELDAAIYALYGESNLKTDVRKEQALRNMSTNASRSHHVESAEMPAVGRTSATNSVLHRIRINSAYILKHLHELSDIPERDVKHHIFFRPFRPLIELQPRMKTALENLQKKWGNIENADATPEKTTDDVADLKASSPELLDSKRALRHMEAYVNFIDDDVMPLYTMFDDPTRTKVAFHELWYLFREGQYIYRQPPANKKSSSTSGPSTSNSSTMATYQTLVRACSILLPPVANDADGHVLNPGRFDSDSSDYGSSTHDLQDVTIQTYYIDFDGESYIPRCLYEDIPPYDTPKDITELKVYPLRYYTDKDVLLKTQKESGERFKKLIEQKHVYHFGWTVSHDPDGWDFDREGDYRQHVDSEFIIDCSEAFKSSPDWEPFPYNPFLGENSSNVAVRWNICPASDTRHKTRIWSTSANHFDEVAPDEDCVIAWSDNVTAIHHGKFVKSDRFLSGIAKDEGPAPEGEEICLLPKRVFGFALRERRFFIVETRNLKPLQVQENVWRMLKIDSNNKRMVQSLVKEHFRKKEFLKGHVESVNQDAIRGKGAGLIFLLHGVPGVGKTATAEAVAQENKRPLFSITCGDLGIEPGDVERNLTRIFRLASLWDCILLLDEADIFFTRRQITDLQRNALVTVFLRVLEYYNGILFLTTNRVGTIDEAFKSRIHVSLYYKDLDWDQTKQIFKYNMERLAELERMEPNKDSRLLIDESSIMMWADNHFHQNQKLGRWNGRQIRNAFQTAVSLAHYDGQDDELTVRDPTTGRRILNYTHFAKVFETTRQFDEYMAKTALGTDAELAHRARTRLNDHEKAMATRDVSFGAQYGHPPQTPTPTFAGHGFQRPASESSPSTYRSPSGQPQYQAIDSGRGASPLTGMYGSALGGRSGPAQLPGSSQDPAMSMGYESHEKVYVYREAETGLDSLSGATQGPTRPLAMNFPPSDMRPELPMVDRNFSPYQSHEHQTQLFGVDNRVGI